MEDDKEITANDYAYLFTEHSVGQKVFMKMYELFYDRLSYDANNINNTIFMEGQRSVVKYILDQIVKVGEENGHE